MALPRAAVQRAAARNFQWPALLAIAGYLYFSLRRPVSLGFAAPTATSQVTAGSAEVDEKALVVVEPEAKGVEIEFFTLDMCPYAQRTWIVLEEKGLSYERRPVNLQEPEERQWYVANVNPLGKVPSIRDVSDDLVVYESEIVNEYLEQKYSERGEGLMPTSAASSARVRLWNQHLNGKLVPALFTYLMNKDEDTDDAKRDALEDALQYYEDHLEGPFLVGEQFTLADVSALPFFERLTVVLKRFKGYEIPEAMSRLNSWLELVMARPSFLVTKRPEDKLAELYHTFIEMDYKFGGHNRN